MKRIFVEGPVHPRGMEILHARTDLEIDYHEKPSAAVLAEGVQAADALILRLTPLPTAVIDTAAKLKVVSRMGVGYDHIDVAALSRRGIPLAIVGDALAASVAEHTLMLMLGISRQVAVMDRNTRTGRYDQRLKSIGHEILNKTVLIIGLGGIGRTAARMCRAFGMTVIASGRESSKRVAAEEGYSFVEDFHAALPEVDFVSLHLPANPDGSALLGAAEFAAMKPGAYVINTARGSLIDEEALYAALTTGTLGGAGLDVTRQEPPAADCPLLALDNILFTPHHSALCEETAERVSITSVENALAGLNGTLNPSLVVNRSVL
ncbi:MAG: hydroxyacid dehydrogenase [Rhodospirillales bacterium]